MNSWVKSKNNHDTFSWIEQRKLKWMKKQSKICHFCNKPIRWWQFSIGCCGSFDYVRAHRKCAIEHNTNRILNTIKSRMC